MKRNLLVILALVGLLSALAVSHASAATQTTSPVVTMDAAASVVGSSTVTRTGSGISMSLHTTRLPAGDAVTIWWMVFNHPDACISGATAGGPRCGMADMGNPAADLSVLYAAGHVIDDSGVADFGGRLAVDDADGAIMGTPRPRPGRPGHGQPADPHLRRLQPWLHRPADVGPPGQLGGSPARPLSPPWIRWVRND